MPSPLIHSAVAAASAHLASRPGAGRAAFVLCLAAANLPDLDFIPGFLAGDPVKFHHQFTHSFAFAAVSALALSLPEWGKEGARWLKRYLVLLLCAASHPFLDAFTEDTLNAFKGAPSGPMLAWPFSAQRWAGPAVFQGGFISIDWRDWMIVENFKVLSVEGGIAAVLLITAFAVRSARLRRADDLL